jgi:periplasmic divalent cation tolerance protein
MGMLVKTKEELVEEVVKRVKELHSYEVPGVVCLDGEKGNKEFLEWVEKETR